MSDAIQPIVMPKWGLAMQEGMLAKWHVEEGAALEKGQEIADIETSKIANIFESPTSGKLRRRVAGEGETVPVGALLAVLAEDSVDDAAIDAFIEEFQARFEAEAAEIQEAGPEPETVDAGGRRIRYLKMGEAEGPPVLLLHGFGGDLLTWMFNQEPLAEQHTTYALELPGHGGSTKDVGEGSVTAMTAAVADFMKALGIDRAHLVGHSLGGAISLDMAVNQPDKVASATLICPAGLGPDINREFLDGFISAKRGKQLRPVLEMLVAHPEVVTREMIEEVLKFKRLDGVVDALTKVAETCFGGGRQALILTDRLESLTMPVQVLWGTKDRIIPASHGHGLPGNIRTRVIEDAGHLPHMEKASEVNAEILAFIGKA